MYICGRKIKDMEYRRLGKSGLQVSALSFGSWVTFGAQIGDNVFVACLENFDARLPDREPKPRSVLA